MASEAAEAGLRWPMSPALNGRGHMHSFNLLGQTVSESKAFTQEYGISGTQMYTYVNNQHNVYLNFCPLTYRGTVAQLVARQIRIAISFGTYVRIRFAPQFLLSLSSPY